MKTCFCGRAPRGFAFMDFESIASERRETVHCCSMECLKIASKRKGDMNLDIDEKKAIAQASEQCGGYLESIGKTDLATMTGDEWLGFLGHVYASVSAQVREICDDDIPF